MVWLEDPLTGDTTHRTIVEEEDERQAQELAAQYTVAPTLRWDAGAPVQGYTVVFLIGQAACLLSGTAFKLTLPIASIAVPELVRLKSPLEEEYGGGQQPVHRCLVHGLITSSVGRSGGTAPVMVVACPRELPAEQSATWAREVVAALQPAAVVVSCTVPAASYRGPGSPADEDLVFWLHTSAAKDTKLPGGQPETAEAAEGQQAGAAPAPPLPAGTLLGGLPAALLTEAELRQLPGVLVAGVQQQQVPDASFLGCLAESTAGALRRLGCGDAAPEREARQSRAQLLSALAAAADAVYRSSASSSIFA